MSEIYWRTILGRVERFAAHYKGPLFHALLTDPPYHLTTITERFGKPDSAPQKHGKDGRFARLAKGFMGQEWDGGDIAFRPDTWAAFADLLYPGGFGIAFSSSRTVHRMAVAIEDAGLIIHPMLFGWCYSSGFPKATGLEHRLEDEELAAAWSGHRYGTQALKPALEPIIIFQKPYDGRPIDNMLANGAGALNIDAGRIGSGVESGASGRWPANFYLVHSPGCRVVGHTQGDQYAINRFTDGAKPFGGGAGHKYEGHEVSLNVPVWECVENCPATLLDTQSGKLNGDEGGASRFFHQAGWAYEIEENLLHVDSIAYISKASKAERDGGVEDYEGPEIHNRFDTCGKCGGTLLQNPDRPSACKCEEPERVPNKVTGNFHPTVKPIALTRWLASLLLPPARYAPRRIFIPFAGVASEMVGAFQAGWDIIVGVEATASYMPLNRKRMRYWMERGHQLDLFK